MRDSFGREERSLRANGILRWVLVTTEAAWIKPKLRKTRPENWVKCAHSRTAWWMTPSLSRQCANVPAGSPFRGDNCRYKRARAQQSSGAEATYQEFSETIFPYPMGNIHPRVFGLDMGNGTVLGALADMMARDDESQPGRREHVANLVEEQVVNWIKRYDGFSKDSSGAW